MHFGLLAKKFPRCEEHDGLAASSLRKVFADFQ